MDVRIFAVLAAIAVAVGSVVPAAAQSESAVVENAWSRASIGTRRPGVAYMQIRNVGASPITLTGVEADLAEMAEIHRTSTNDQGVSMMAPAGEVEIAPGATVALEPGGLHVMLRKLKRPMNQGDSFSLRISLSDGGEVSVEVPILGIAAQGPQD
ncbi:MAG: copper chaperone PCu(A)C [Pseudomonadota bacterium]